jgi:hypothetical protein
MPKSKLELQRETRARALQIRKAHCANVPSERIPLDLLLTQEPVFENDADLLQFLRHANLPYAVSLYIEKQNRRATLAN